MEPISIGFISSVASAVLAHQLCKYLNEEHNSLGFKTEFDKLKSKLEVMQSFLIGAQQLERNNIHYGTVKQNLAELRELIYDVDDFIVDRQIRADYENVSRIHCYTADGCKVHRNAKFMLNRINKRMDELVAKLSPQVPENPRTQTSGSDEGSSRRAEYISPALNNSRIIGLTEDTKKIIKWMKTDGMTSRIAIWGMGGLGKTTLARKIFNDEGIVKYFDRMIWVTLSQTYSPKDILRSMLKKLGVTDSGPENEKMSLIQDSLKNKKYLIVFDDVWQIDSEWWEQLTAHLPDAENCSNSIIITTRNEIVAKDMGAKYIHEARQLNDVDSWVLFSDVAFSSDKEKKTDSEFEAIGKDIVKQCNGNPLAIRAIAGLLSKKIESRQKWKDICSNFRKEIMEKNALVPTTLQLSYDDLPPKFKYCMLCFSVFPEDTEISAEQMVYWWVGEGFVHGDGTKTAIEVGFEYLSELVSRCLVETVQRRGFDGKINKCKLHDLVRDLLITISNEEGFSSFDEHKKLVKNSRHLGYVSGMNLEDNQKLRAFLLMENSSFPLDGDVGLGKVESLRVLDFSQTMLENISVKDLLNWIKSQKRLAYLNLHKFDGLKELNDWIKKLQNLKILVITECKNLESLPKSITYLQNLLVLDVSNRGRTRLPRGLDRLSKLQMLSGFTLKRKGKEGTSLEELKVLKELRILRISISKNEVIADDEIKILSELEQLRSLSITNVTTDCQHEVLFPVNKLIPPPSLRELFLQSYPSDTTPDWLSPSSLPELTYLYIDEAQLKSVHANFWQGNGKSWKLEGLCFKGLSRFNMEWKDLIKNMNYLRYVEVSYCPGLQSFPIDYVETKRGVWEKKSESEREEGNE